MAMALVTKKAPTKVLPALLKEPSLMDRCCHLTRLCSPLLTGQAKHNMRIMLNSTPPE